MAFCSFGDGAAMFDATPIENLFFIDYMYDAPEQALKVYLYARMLALHPELDGSAADMAKALRMTEDDVLDAFRYWERRGLVQGVSANPPAYQILSLRSQAAGSGSALDQEIYANRDFNNRLQKLFGSALIGQHELNKAADWVELLHFDKDAVVRLVEYGRKNSRVKNPKPASVFKRVDAIAEEWSKRGIHTLQDVERAIAEDQSLGIARDVLKKLGMSRQPSDPELEMAKKWVDEWGYSREQILAAVGDTISARNPTMKYLDSILENQRNENAGDYQALSEVLRELSPGFSRPTPDQLTRYRALLEAGFMPELIRLAAIYCHRVNKTQFGDLEWRLNVWRQDDVTTPEEAEAFMKQMGALSRELRALYREAGSERRPGYGDLQIYRRWKDAYPAELIQFAAECARGARGSMAYMEKLLEGWAQSGVTTVEAARAQHAAFKVGGGGAEKPAPANPALDYQQREYKEEDFGDDFYFNYEKVFGSEGKET